MRRAGRGRIVLAVIIGALAAAPAVAPANAVTDGIPARVSVFTPPVTSAVFSGVDYGATERPHDDRHTRSTWRVVKRTGNCCENYLTVSARGRLLDYGGSYINYSDDRGVTWRQVKPLTPLYNGEGAIVMAPDGDVLGVQWDPYTGDHLQFYKFEADTQQWLYTEQPLHQPFYDREWIGVVPGPVTIGGQTFPYVSFVKGAYPSKEVWFYSTDGLNYIDITSKAASQLLNDTRIGRLPTTANAHNDWIQANSNGGMIQLGRTHLLAAPDLSSEWSLLDGSTFSWSPYRFPGNKPPEGRFQVDSAGRVHNVRVAPDGASFTYRISADGGATWTSRVVRLPEFHTIEEYDFRAHRAAGVAAVAIHAQNLASRKDQDLLYKLDIRTNTPIVKRMYRLGRGDVDSQGGVGNDIRMDFQTLGIYADGRVAVSFLDSTTTSASGRSIPGIAVEGPTVLGALIPVPVTVTPVLGQVYRSYTFDRDAQGWTTTGTPAWSRGAPGVRNGVDHAGSASYGLEGPTQYIDAHTASLTSPLIPTQAGFAVLEFWLKHDLEAGYDFLNVEWSSDDGRFWRPLKQLSGKSAGYPKWQKLTLGFRSPGGDIRIRFRFTSDLLCSAVSEAACGIDVTGVRVDQVVVGKQKS